MIDCGSGYAADGLAGLRDSAYNLGQGFSHDAPPVSNINTSKVICLDRNDLPVCIHADLEGRVCQYSWSPLDSVDLGHESRIDKTGFVEDRVTISVSASSSGP